MDRSRHSSLPSIQFMIHAMIDLETLSTKPNATILTIGGVKFDPYSFTEPSQGMYHRIDVDSQSTMGLSLIHI